jgi:hypothetical protein
VDWCYWSFQWRSKAVGCPGRYLRLPPIFLTEKSDDLFLLLSCSLSSRFAYPCLLNSISHAPLLPFPHFPATHFVDVLKKFSHPWKMPPPPKCRPGRTAPLATPLGLLAGSSEPGMTVAHKKQIVTRNVHGLYFNELRNNIIGVNRKNALTAKCATPWYELIQKQHAAVV